MSRAVLLRPGLVTLADWRAIYRGASVSLDPVSRADVEAGAAALTAVLAGMEPAPPDEASADSPTVAELVQKSGDTLPTGLVRLLAALKLAALGQGLSGVRWKLVQGLADCLSHDLLPAVPAQNASDRLALSHLFGVLTGAGEVISGSGRLPAAKALKSAGLSPIKLGAYEKRALLSGTELSTAFALAGLFEAERVFQSALVAGAFAADASGPPGTLLHPRVHRLSRQAGQADAAAALRALLGTDGDVAPANGESKAQSVELRRFASQMGACLDLLRQAGDTLQRAGNGASEDRLVLWQSEEVVAGLEDASASGLAADLIALALREISGLAEGCIPIAFNGADSDHPGKGPAAMVAGFLAEIRERARPAGLDLNIKANGASSGTPSIARLLPVAGTTSLVIAVAFLAAARACEQKEQASRSPALEAARHRLRDASPQSGGGDAISIADLAAAADLVRSGALAAASGIELPGVITATGRTAV